MMERVNWTLKKQCVHRHRIENQVHAKRVIADCPLLQLKTPQPGTEDDDPRYGLCRYINHEPSGSRWVIAAPS